MEEMNGFSLPCRDVAPPPEGIRFDALIHVDLVEDWTPRRSRSPSSRQSGMPPSSSSEEPPCPAVQPYTWFSNREDGEESRPSTHRRLLTGCQGELPLGRRDDRDDDADRERRLRRDSVLRRDSQGRAPPAGAAGHRWFTPAQPYPRQPSSPRFL
jgi:hypothetical protein